MIDFNIVPVNGHLRSVDVACPGSIPETQNVYTLLQNQSLPDEVVSVTIEFQDDGVSPQRIVHIAITFLNFVDLPAVELPEKLP